MRTTTRSVCAIICGLLLAAPAGAADLYRSGDGTWNTTDANWGTVFGGPYDTATWNNATPDSAFFEAESGVGGTVTLLEDINIANLTFYDNTPANGAQPNEREFTVQGGTLNFKTPQRVDVVCRPWFALQARYNRPGEHVFNAGALERCHHGSQ